MVARTCIMVALPLLLAGAQAASVQEGSAPVVATAAAASTQPEVIAQYVRVTGRAYASLATRFSVESYRLHTDDPPISLQLHVRTLAEYVTAADVVVEAAQDDTGVNLLSGVKAEGVRASNWDSSPISSDHHDAFMELRFSQPPSPGAKEFVFRGFARLQVGREKKWLHATVPLMPGTTFGPPALSFRITSVRGSDHGISLDLEGPAALDRISGIAISDKQGHMLATQPGRVESASQFDRQSKISYYDLPASPDNMEVDVSWFDSLQEVKVPFEFKIGAGMEGK